MIPAETRHGQARGGEVLGGRVGHHDVLCHHTVLATAAAADRPVQVLILQGIGDEDLAGRGDDGGLQDLVGGEPAGAG